MFSIFSEQVCGSTSAALQQMFGYIQRNYKNLLNKVTGRKIRGARDLVVWQKKVCRKDCVWQTVVWGRAKEQSLLFVSTALEMYRYGKYGSDQRRNFLLATRNFSDSGFEKDCLCRGTHRVREPTASCKVSLVGIDSMNRILNDIHEMGST